MKYVQPVKLLIVTLLLYSCGKHLQPCHVNAIETLGKGLATVGTAVPAAIKEVKKISIEKNTQSLTKAIEVDSSSDPNNVLNEADKVSDDIFKEQVAAASNFSRIVAVWDLCNQYAALLLAVASPDQGKAVGATAETWGPAIDSLILRYNGSTTNNKINTNVGPGLAALGKLIGTHRLKAEQKKIIKRSMRETEEVMYYLLETVKNPMLLNLAVDVQMLQAGYFSNYSAYQQYLLEGKIDKEKMVAIIGELTEVKAKLALLDMLERKLTILTAQSLELFSQLNGALQNNQRCNITPRLNGLSASLLLTIAEINQLSGNFK